MGSEEARIVANLAGGFGGAIAAGLVAQVAMRLLGHRGGIRGRTWAAMGIAQLAALIVGGISGSLGEIGAKAFLAPVQPGNGALVAAVVAGAAFAVLSSLLVVVLEANAVDERLGDHVSIRSTRSEVWSIIFEGGLVGAITASLGGSIIAAVTEAAISNLPQAIIGRARQGMLLAGWTGSLVGLLATSAFLAVVRFLRWASAPPSRIR
jgi:hypothetical protein